MWGKVASRMPCGIGRLCTAFTGASMQWVHFQPYTPSSGTMRPNHSLNRTRYGKHRKPGLRHMVHHLSPG